MTRIHRRSQPGLKAHTGLKPRALQEANAAEGQANIFKGMYGSPGQHERRLNNWIRGVDTFDEEINKWASQLHLFRVVRQGLDLCAKCDQPYDTPIVGGAKNVHVTEKEMAIIRARKAADKAKARRDAQK